MRTIDVDTNDTALLVSAHGSPETLDDLPQFLTNIRRGRAPTPEILAEVRRRYEAIGGVSPLSRITRVQADRLAQRLGMRVWTTMRLWRPYPADVVREMISQGVRRIVSVPIAPYSVHVYHDAVTVALSQPDLERVELVRIPPWNLEPALVRALANEVQSALAALPADARTVVMLSAHSLPLRVIEGGDPYARLFEETVGAVVAAMPRPVEHRLVFQSQGMTGDAWLGPDLPAAFRAARDEGFTHVVLAPIGFVADHIEILYDIDIEAQALARDLGLTLSRARTLNDAPGLVDALESVVRRALAT